MIMVHTHHAGFAELRRQLCISSLPWQWNQISLQFILEFIMITQEFIIAKMTDGVNL